VLVVTLVSFALVGLSAREPGPTGEQTDEALVIDRDRSGLSYAAGTAIAAICFLGTTAIVLYGLYVIAFWSGSGPARALRPPWPACNGQSTVAPGRADGLPRAGGSVTKRSARRWAAQRGRAVERRSGGRRRKTGQLSTTGLSRRGRLMRTVLTTQIPGELGAKRV
jgi:hypothetical protein